jgi:hypothetical protein
MLERGVQDLSQNDCKCNNTTSEVIVNCSFGIQRINKFCARIEDRSYLLEHPRSGIEREGGITSQHAPKVTRETGHPDSVVVGVVDGLEGGGYGIDLNRLGNYRPIRNIRGKNH